MLLVIFQESRRRKLPPPNVGIHAGLLLGQASVCRYHLVLVAEHRSTLYPAQVNQSFI